MHVSFVTQLSSIGVKEKNKTLFPNMTNRGEVLIKRRLLKNPESPRAEREFAIQKMTLLRARNKNTCAFKSEGIAPAVNRNLPMQTTVNLFLKL